MAKAADCKSAIVGSTPTGASFFLLAKKWGTSGGMLFQSPSRFGVGGGLMVPQETPEQGKRPSADRPSLMIVEVAGSSQDSLRNFFSDQGFRTLVTQDPQRALMRFKTHPRPDFLLLSAQVLQEAALEAFNAFSRDPYLARVPVLIIGSAKQQEFFANEARTDDFRKVLLMPFKASTLRNVVNELIALAQKKPGAT